MSSRTVMVEGFARILPERALATLDQLVPLGRWRDELPDRFWTDPRVVAHLEDPGRYRMYAKLAEVIGQEAADATLEHLPPVPWRVLEEAGVARHLLR